MVSTEEVRVKQMGLMLDKALKHFRLANHWLERVRREYPEWRAIEQSKPREGDRQ